MDIFHVEIICRHGIGDGVRGQCLWLLDGISFVSKASGPVEVDLRSHQLGVELNRMVSKFGCRDRLQTLTSLW